MKILQIVTKNTSTLDYLLPILWSLRRAYPKDSVAILCCASNKKQILRGSHYLPIFFKAHHIELFDYADFLKVQSPLFQRFWRWLFQKAPNDHFSLLDLKAARLHPLTLFSVLLERFLLLLEKIIGPYLVALPDILPQLSPDLVFFDQQTTTRGFFGRPYFKEYVERSKTKIVLVPHAPHFIGPTEEYHPYYDENRTFGEFCDFWRPFERGTPWDGSPYQEGQFPFIGYPGLDDDWNTFLFKSSAKQRGGKLKCLLIIRKFLPRGLSRPENFDPATFNYDEMLDYLEQIARAAEHSEYEVEFIVKPHPSNNFGMLVEIFQRSGLKHWSISHEPLYALLPSIDFVVSIFSTSILIPLLADIPLVLVNSKLQDYVHQRWKVLEEIYKGLEFFVEKPSEFSSSFQQALQIALLRRNATQDLRSRDAIYLRHYFPDGAIRRSMHRMESLLQIRQSSGKKEVGELKWH